MKELRELLALATPGPWHVDPKATPDEGHRVSTDPGTNADDDDRQGMEWIATFYDGNRRGPGPNAYLTVILRNLSPLMLDVVEAGEKWCANSGGVDCGCNECHELHATLTALRDAVQKEVGDGK